MTTPRYPTRDQVIYCRAAYAEEILARAVRAVRRVWPLAQFVDPHSGNYYGANAEIPVSKLTELTAYKDETFRTSNAAPSTGHAVPLIASKGTLTFAGGRPDSADVDAIFEALDLELRGIS